MKTIGENGRSSLRMAVAILAMLFKASAVLLDKVATECELEALSLGTRLADRYNMYDEQTEWDVRIHNDYLVEHLGFSGWIQLGLYKNTKLTAERQDAPALHRVIGRHRIAAYVISILRSYAVVLRYL